MPLSSSSTCVVDGTMKPFRGQDVSYPASDVRIVRIKIKDFWCLSRAELLSNESTMCIFTVSCTEDYGVPARRDFRRALSRGLGTFWRSRPFHLWMPLMLALSATGLLNRSRFLLGRSHSWTFQRVCSCGRTWKRRHQGPGGPQW